MMSTKRIELKVAINCQKCKTKVLTAASKLHGIDELTVNVEKGTLIVVGTVDPLRVVKIIKKAKIYTEIISVGPPKKPELAKQSEKKPEFSQPLPSCCQQCQLVPVIYDHDHPNCSIL